MRQLRIFNKYVMLAKRIDKILPSLQIVKNIIKPNVNEAIRKYYILVTSRKEQQ
jgi:hypothetical protein